MVNYVMQPITYEKMFLLLVTRVAVAAMQENYVGAASFVTFNGADIIAHATSINSNSIPVTDDGRINFKDYNDVKSSIGT